MRKITLGSNGGFPQVFSNQIKTITLSKAKQQRRRRHYFINLIKDYKTISEKLLDKAKILEINTKKLILKERRLFYRHREIFQRKAYKIITL